MSNVTGRRDDAHAKGPLRPAPEHATSRSLARSLATIALAMVASCVASCVSGCADGPQPVTLQVHLHNTHYRLPNGLEVVLHSDASHETVAVHLRYHVGSKDDPEGLGGLAHLQEHLMFLGSARGETAGFAEALQEAGVIEFNATTTNDRTDYYESMPARELPAALWLEADRMAHRIDRVSLESFERERNVVKNEWRERDDNVAFGRVASVVRGALFPDSHPYRHPVIGTAEDLERVSLDQAKAFSARFYTPANATLVVVGDFDVARARELVDQYFGHIPSGTLPAAKSFRFPRLLEDRRITMEADVEAGQATVGWLIPPPNAPGWQEIQFAIPRIAGCANSRLIYESKMARSLSYEVTPGRLGSTVTFTTDMVPGKDPSEAISEFEYCVDVVINDEPKNFTDQRTGRMARNVVELSNFVARANRIQDYLENFHEPDAAQKDLQRIQAVSVRDCAEATNFYFDDRHKVVVLVQPKRGAPRSGRIVEKGR